MLVGALAIANSFYLGCLFLALGGLFCAWYLDRQRAAVTRGERIAAHVLFGWGILWWVVGGLHEIRYHVSYAYREQAALLFFTGSCVAFSWLHTRLDWRAARYAALAQLPLMIVYAAIAVGAYAHPFARVGWIAWPLAFVAHFLVLRRHDDAREPLSVLGACRRAVALRRARQLGGRLDDRRAGARARRYGR